VTKLINAYRKMPSLTNRGKLVRYLNRHMMATCMATAEEMGFLRAYGFVE